MSDLARLADSMTDQSYADTIFRAKQQKIPEAFRAQEPGLEAPMFSPDDLIGSGIGTKLAMLAKLGAGKLAGSGALAGMPALVGMFAGKGAKTADVVKLALAEKMKASGIADDVIHAKTGWFFGMPDGKPRFEIPDNAAKLNMNELPLLERGIRGGSGNVPDLISHPDLYKNYPMSDVEINLTFGPADATGGGRYLNNFIEASGENSQKAKSTALHELQHAIQQREGFARGGSPESFNAESVHWLEGMGIKTNNALERAKQSGGIDPETGLDAQTLQKNVEDLWTKYNAAKQSKPINTFEQYQRLAGESEARLTQARMNMTPAERAASYPPSMFDVPVEQQIVRYGDNGPQMATAYHGSPHLFDKFKNEAIGTGEGAQAYGHGLYLAENPDVAKTYKNVVNYNSPAFNRLPLDARLEELANRKEGALYKTDIPDAHIDKMLDWDKPLSDQHPDVQAALKTAYANSYGVSQKYVEDQFATGRSVGNAVGAGRMSKQMTDALQAQGIPGIKYLDGSSRTAGEGTRNFVMFNPDDIRILERNGVATGAKPWSADSPMTYDDLLSTAQKSVSDMMARNKR